MGAEGPRPIVVGYPRTGFTLLISIVTEIRLQAGRVRAAPGGALLRAFCETAGESIAQGISAVFARRGLEGAMIYNRNFQQMLGGPKWLKPDGRTAAFRKYIGLKGGGDFTIITSHPKAVLDDYDLIHSHVDPGLWTTHPDYADRPRFVSMRHPAGALTSACFSINALASEYIQRFVPAAEDNDLIRQRLALYKLSDLNFFEALVGPFKAWFDAFQPHQAAYRMMRWEDLILRPQETVLSLARDMDVDLAPDQAAAIWAKLDHVNLTGAHRHNYRAGHGVVGGWRSWITNDHLEMMRAYGLHDAAEHYGYGPLEPLDPAEYTPFQRRLADLIGRGEVFRDYGDEDLFEFAFNKSNLDLDRFPFKRYPWRTHTQIERSTCKDDALVMEVWDTAEFACERINAALARMPGPGANDPRSAVQAMIGELEPLYADAQALSTVRSALLAAVDEQAARPRPAPPVLVQSVGVTNIVAFDGAYYAVPQALGPLDFFTDAVAEMPGVKVSRRVEDALAAAGA